MFKFTPFAPFRAAKNDSRINSMLERIGKESQAALQKGMREQSRKSLPGEWPFRRTGKLYRSAGYQISKNQVTIGTNMPYSPYLAYGTRKMSPRKMSKEALQETIPKIFGKNDGLFSFVAGKKN